MTDNQALEVRIGPLFRARGLTLAVAESCTGGLITHRITNVNGSSGYLLGGVVAYAYEAKEKLLGVDHDTLVQHGAVSEEVALQMAHGVRARFGADVAISVTGIAGPGGGMPGKPVGLTYLALVAPGAETVIRRVWEKDREGNKTCSADTALEMLLNYLSA